MSIQLYIVIAMIVAFYFAVLGGLEQGDYARALTMILCAALWPLSVAFGTGIMLSQAYHLARRVVRKLAA